MNPYDFIPLGNPSARRPPPGHDTLPSTAGNIRARLTTQGPFLIARQNHGQNPITPLEAGKVIPGSSLKGMFRSLAEMAGGGCISLSSSLYERGEYRYRRHAEAPGAFAPCSDIDQLCVTCRMFGALIRGAAWKRLVAPGEARWQGGGGMAPTRLFNVIVGQPKPDHAAFYVKGNRVRGRKAYYHHPDAIIQSAPARQVAFGALQTFQVRALEPGQVYELNVRHEGLEADEYALLLYALFLEEGLAHKLGWGKPMGFGSVKIEPLGIEETDLRARYRRGGGSATRKHEGAAASARVAELTDKLRSDTGEVMVAVRKLFACPGPAVETWAYPTYSWFKANPLVSLEDFNAGR